MFRKLLLIVLSLAALAYVVVGALFYFLQDALIYYPSTYPAGVLEGQAAKAGFEPWRNAKGEQIGWLSKEGDAQNALLVFHGQGGNALVYSFLPQYTKLRGGWKIYLLEYPGNGNRPGPPSEKALTAAGVEAIDLLKTPGRRIWLLGQSLGSGVASAVVRERPGVAAGIIFLTPFNSLVATAAAQYPFMPVAPFLKTRFDSEKNLANYRGPVAFFLCEKDTTIPVRLGRKLYEGFAGPKKLWIDAQRDHDATAILYDAWPALIPWLETNGLASSP